MFWLWQGGIYSYMEKNKNQNSTEGHLSVERDFGDIWEMVDSIFFCRIQVKLREEVSCLLEWGVNVAKLVTCLPLAWLHMVLLSFDALIQSPQVISFSSLHGHDPSFLDPIQIPCDSTLLLHESPMVSFLSIVISKVFWGINWIFISPLSVLF